MRISAAKLNKYFLIHFEKKWGVYYLPLSKFDGIQKHQIIYYPNKNIIILLHTSTLIILQWNRKNFIQELWFIIINYQESKTVHKFTWEGHLTYPDFDDIFSTELIV